MSPESFEPAHLIFASSFSVTEPGNGAAIATLEALALLQRQGFACQAFCSSKMELGWEECFEKTLSDQNLLYEVRNATIGSHRARVVFAASGDIPITTICAKSTQPWINYDDDVIAFLAAYEVFLERNKADIVMTYGGDVVSEAVISLSKRRNIPVVFAVHNLEYDSPHYFRDVDHVIVPSEFARRAYWNRLSLPCHVLPYAIGEHRVKAEGSSRQLLTFVNPQMHKGAMVLARVVQQLYERRPDVGILVIESRGKAADLRACGLDVDWDSAVVFIESKPDPREFYGVSKVVLMPSLFEESFGLVAAEVMINGIPVLASNRGALPKTVGDAGFIFDIPAKYTPFTTEVPTAEEVEPWVETIIRLWDDEKFYNEASQRARAHAERWRPERIAPLYKEFFENVFQQPGPPIVPKEGGG